MSLRELGCASLDEMRISYQKVKALIDQASAPARNLGAGARPQDPQEVSMSTMLRRAAGYPN